MRLLYPRGANRTQKNEQPGGAINFLHENNNMVRLLPTVTRLIALQKACNSLLPPMFNACQVLHFDDGNLLFSVPNAALASKLKQQLPHIQSNLVLQGWQVNAIRLKVQVPQPISVATTLPKRHLSTSALNAFATLGEMLDDAPQNAALKAAVLALARRA